MQKALLRASRPCLFLLFLLWSGWVFLVFLGEYSHLGLLTGSAADSIFAQGDSSFPRGFASVPTVFTTFAARLQPLGLYLIIGLLLSAGFAFRTYLTTGNFSFEMTLSPLRLLLLFIGSIWLLHSSLLYSAIPGVQPTLLAPFVPEQGEQEEERIALEQENLERLRSVGCLSESSGITHYRFRCLQWSFVTRVLPPIALLLFLTLNFLVLGESLLRLLRMKTDSLLLRGAMCTGLGAALLILFLWSLATAGMLRTLPVWTLVLGIPILGFHLSKFWVQALWRAKWKARCNVRSVSCLLVFLLITILALNYLTVLRTFPIGWDDSGRYLNTPKQAAEFGTLLPGMYLLQWEYLTATGFLLFGASAPYGALLAQIINWFSGALAVLAIVVAARWILQKSGFFVSAASGLLAALFYYTLPMVGHFSYIDMKTENALLFFGALGTLAIFLHLDQKREPETNGAQDSGFLRGTAWLFLAGILFAAGFATKPTMLITFLMGGIILVAGQLGWLAGLGATLLVFGILFAVGVPSLANIFTKILGDPHWLLATWIINGCLLAGFLLIVLSPFFRRTRVRNPLASLLSLGTAAAILLAGFLSYSSPWMIRNMVALGRMDRHAVLSPVNHITPWIANRTEELTLEAPPGSRSLPASLQYDPNHEHCKNTTRAEELERYWGDYPGIGHYLGVPWRTVMNRDTQGFYLTTSPLLLILPLLLLFPTLWRKRLVLLLLAGTSFHILQWMFSGNGIPWYGIGAFLGCAILLEALPALAPNRPLRLLMVFLISTALFLNLSMRFGGMNDLFPLHDYAWGIASAQLHQERTMPHTQKIAAIAGELSKDPARPYLYRIGTPIRYSVPRNLETIPMNDNQLSFFDCLNQEENHALTLQRLQALGFHSIVFDTAVATIEADPEGTLHQKARRFLSFANDPAVGVFPVVNDIAGRIAYMILP